MSRLSRTIVGLCIIVSVAGLAGCAKKVTKVDTAPTMEQKEAPIEPFNPTEGLKPMPMEDNMRSVLVPVYFDYDKYNLRSDALAVMEKVGPYLAENASMRVLIEGHADERGTDEYNMGLGENRAKTVRSYLVKYGIAKNRLEMVSYGKSRPANPNCPDDECHSVNRRVEWSVLSK